jgi:hypothetical protein
MLVFRRIGAASALAFGGNNLKDILLDASLLSS